MSNSSPQIAQAGTHRWIWVGGLVCALAYGGLSWRGQAYGEAGLGDLLAVFTVTQGVTLALFYLAWQQRLNLSVTTILWFALLFRLIGLTGYPVLEDDHFRYLWDGWVTLQFGSPYGVPPEAFFGDPAVPERLQPILDGINYPGVPTVYGPTAQLLFAFGAWLDAGNVLPLQIAAGTADLAVLWLLRHRTAPCWLLLYGWHFLMIKEFAFTAHIDVIAACLLLAAVLLRLSHRTAAGHPLRRSLWLSLGAGALAALAVGCKLFCLVALPFVLQTDVRAWLAAGVTAILIALPFGIVNAWLPGGLDAMASDWLFNAPLPIAAAALWGSNGVWVAKLLCLLTLAAICVVQFWRYCGMCLWPARHWWQAAPLVAPMATDNQPGYLRGLSTCLGAMLLLSPVVNPWYFALWLPFACLVPARTPWVCASVVVLSYIMGINLPQSGLALYQQPASVLLVEAVLVLGALFWDWRKPLHTTGAAA